tara:strand:- start:316 stop:486 length:171 start_codon:yes stop_codon:yes gene_type:complete
MEAGKLLVNLPVLWEEADLAERSKLLMAMLNAVYVDTLDEKSVVAIRPKPAVRPIF